MATAKAGKTAAGAADQPSRRQAIVELLTAPFKAIFGSWFAAGWISFTVGTVSAVLSCVRFLYPNALREPPMTFKVGPPEAFEEGVVRTDWKVKYGVWIVRYRNQIYALRAGWPQR